MGDYSELGGELDPGRRWCEPLDRLYHDVSALGRTPVLHFFRYWQEKDKRYLLVLPS